MMASYYVEDSTGNKFCYTIADADYEKQFREHARWWMRTGWRHTAKAIRAEGHWHRIPVGPFKVVVKP